MEARTGCFHDAQMLGVAVGFEYDLNRLLAPENPTGFAVEQLGGGETS